MGYTVSSLLENSFTIPLNFSFCFSPETHNADTFFVLLLLWPLRVKSSHTLFPGCRFDSGFCHLCLKQTKSIFSWFFYTLPHHAWTGKFQNTGQTAIEQHLSEKKVLSRGKWWWSIIMRIEGVLEFKRRKSNSPHCAHMGSFCTEEQK